MRIAITGSSGLIGTALTGHLRGGGHEVIKLVRRPAGAVDEVHWNSSPAAGGKVAAARQTLATLEGIDAAVHLAGAPIASRRWTAARKQEIRASRVDGTRALAALLAALRQSPGRAAVRLSDRLVRRYRRSRRDRIRTRRQRISVRRRSGLGGCDRRGGASRDPGRKPADWHRSLERRRDTRQASAVVPVRARRQARAGHPIHELDRDGRCGRRDQLLA